MRAWQVERRKRTRQLIELGGLVVKAGLVDLSGDDRAMIYGALLWMANKLQSDQGEHARGLWTAKGSTRSRMTESKQHAPFDMRHDQGKENAARIRRLTAGNPGDVKSVGEGVSEMRIDYGPGYPAVFYETRRHDRAAALWRRQRHPGSGHRARDRDGKGVKKMAVKIAKWDTADILTTPARVAAYLDAILEDGDPDLLKHALGDIARSKGMAEIAEKAGIRRTSLYKSLSPDGNPEFTTIASVLRAMGLRLSVVPAHEQCD